MGSGRDTTPEIEAVQLRLLRQKSPAERAMLALRLSSDVIGASKRAIARAHPELTPSEVDRCFIDLHYGRELGQAVSRYVEARNAVQPE